MPTLAWTSGSCSHLGNVRERNEDACLNRPDCGIWAVADGMGGHLHGDVASNKTIEAMAAQPDFDSLDKRVDAIAAALDHVNRELIEFVDDVNDVCGTTVAILLIAGGEAACLWAGDSRVYQYRRGRLQQITSDHLDIDDVGDQSEDVEHYLGRAIGKDDELLLDLCSVKLEDGDRFLLCTDGLYGELDDAEMESVLATTITSKHAAHRLVEAALDRDCYDNATAVVVDIEEWS